MNRMRDIYLPSTTIILFASAVFSISTGCSRKQPSFILTSDPERETQLARCRKFTGTTANAKVTALYHYADHEMLNGLEEWILFFPGKIEPQNVFSEGGWMDMGWVTESIVKVLKVRIPNLEVDKSVRSFSGHWKIDGRPVDGEILQMNDKSYIHLTVGPFEYSDKTSHPIAK
jgi:hypothetical protein